MPATKAAAIEVGQGGRDGDVLVDQGLGLPDHKLVLVLDRLLERVGALAEERLPDIRVDVLQDAEHARLAPGLAVAQAHQLEHPHPDTDARFLQSALELARCAGPRLGVLDELREEVRECALAHHLLPRLA
eukprot:CAMPEP_0180109958 /NCGR_PEP_ID=MMETSP0985-20121206/34770_1 /TAXON_ID=483367 /ORGANISM="non described non described, Strain CCMP 2436" /LENGTH=130 /DNA_ID=CAMNT_0022047917 /DNA_START=177 /DNA_END=565 /DNA_ORIENTATION=+